MKNWKSLLALFLALILAVGVLAGCQTTSQPDDTKASDNPSDPKTSDTPSTAPEDDVYQMKGSVTIAYPEAEIAEIQPVL